MNHNSQVVATVRKSGNGKLVTLALVAIVCASVFTGVNIREIKEGPAGSSIATAVHATRVELARAVMPQEVLDKEAADQKMLSELSVKVTQLHEENLRLAALEKQARVELASALVPQASVKEVSKVASERAYVVVSDAANSALEAASKLSKKVARLVSW